jgi:hypothetical protein
MTGTDRPRAITADELQRDFLEDCRGLVDYWAGPNVDRASCYERMQGLLHSFLCIIDGVSGEMPAFDLVARPHPDDKAYHQAEGENWIEDGTVINDTMLHELLYVPGREDGWRKHVPGDGRSAP